MSVAEPSDWESVVARARERIADRQARREAMGIAYPEDGAAFPERYDHLVGEMADLLEEIPEIEVERLGTSGLKIRFPPTEREVRVTPLEEQALVHFVFAHTTLGTLHRSEHHASRPFGQLRPDAPRLLRQILNFLIEGLEPRWLSQRPSEPRAAREGSPEGEVLELPLD
jgi:hypothetical protein